MTKIELLELKHRCLQAISYGYQIAKPAEIARELMSDGATRPKGVVTAHVLMAMIEEVEAGPAPTVTAKKSVPPSRKEPKKEVTVAPPPPPPTTEPSATTEGESEGSKAVTSTPDEETGKLDS